MKDKKYIIQIGMKIILAILMLSVILFVIDSVSAIGVSPGRTTMDFTPNLNKLSSEISIDVYNTESKEMDVAVVVEGELKDYINVSSELLSFNSNEEMKTISYEVMLNKGLGLTPGEHRAEVVLVDVPKNQDDLGTVIRTSVSVVSELIVYVFYPGKHLEARLDIKEKDDGDVYFYIPIIARGNETIDKVKAEIIIYNSYGEEVTRLESKSIGLGPGERNELLSVWESPENGRFVANCNIYYDGEKKTIKKEFSVGKNLELVSVSVDKFNIGEIAKIKVIVNNKMDEIIKDSFANLVVYDSKLEKIADLNSEHYELNPKKNTEMIIYWDTDGLTEGVYDSDLKIVYDSEFLEKSFKIDVEDDSMKFRSVGFAISSEESSKRFKMSSILYIIIGILVLVNLIWLVIYIRDRKKKRAGKNEK